MMFSYKKEKEKNKELEIIKRICFERLDHIEKKLMEIEKSLNLDEININKSYDKIMIDIDRLIKQIDIVAGFEYKREILERKNELDCILDKILKKIFQIGTANRKEVLNKLNRIDTFNKPNEEIKELLEWIWDRLNLDNIEMEDDISKTLINRINQSGSIMGKLTNSSISSRQINSYESCVNHSITKNTQEAIHSLFEFVDNYQYNIQEPFNSYERLSIRIMIKVIIKSM